MRVRSDPDPLSTPDRGVDEALERLGCYLVYKRLRFNTLTGEKLWSLKTRDFFWYPRWHVYLDEGGEAQHWLFAVQDEAGGHLKPSKAVPWQIITDLGRTKTGDEIADLVEAGERERKETGEARYSQLQADTFGANPRKIDEVLEGDGLTSGAQPHMRDPKIVSYPGQVDRSTRLDTIEQTPQELGWELPNWDEEMRDG